LKFVGVDWLPEVVPWSGQTAVSLDQPDAIERDGELLGDQLHLRSEIRPSSHLPV
jgi:hypothetical protein